jgi:hypothetical protein
VASRASGASALRLTRRAAGVSPAEGRFSEMGEAVAIACWLPRFEVQGKD